MVFLIWRWCESNLKISHFQNSDITLLFPNSKREWERKSLSCMRSNFAGDSRWMKMLYMSSFASNNLWLRPWNIHICFSTHLFYYESCGRPQTGFLPCSLFFHQIRSDQISHSVVSDSLWPHESQHARPPCPAPTPGVHSDSRPLSQWCHPAISSSVVPFSSCPQSLPASESFPMSQVFAWGG